MRKLSRRELLYGAVTGAGAVTLAAAGARTIQTEPDRKIGWAILGLGGYAQGQILPNIGNCRHSELRALISGSPDKANRIADQYGVPREKIYNYDNLEAIADDPDIDVVYVITPPGTHHEFTMRSLAAGKHVCCEKPMASNVRECQEMVDLARENGLRLQIGYRCHYENHNLAAMEWCRDGDGGPLRTIRSEHGFVLGNNSVWHTSGELGGHGAISEIGVYSIQAMCYLAGEDPVEVWGTRDKLDPEKFAEVEDVNHFNLMFPSGVQGIGAASYTWWANNFRVFKQYANLNAEPATGYGGHDFRINGERMEVSGNNQWADQMDDLSLAILDETRELKAPGEMGLRDIKIIEAILESADTGRSVRLE